MAPREVDLRVSLNRKVTRGSWEEVTPRRGKSERGNPQGCSQTDTSCWGGLCRLGGRKESWQVVRPTRVAFRTSSFVISKPNLFLLFWVKGSVGNGGTSWIREAASYGKNETHKASVPVRKTPGPGRPSSLLAPDSGTVKSQVLRVRVG